MKQYPYNSPVILNDSNFLLYGGRTGTSSQAQRDIAYQLAEEQATEYLNSFLVPTVVTGTYFLKSSVPIQLDYGNILGINQVMIDSVDGRNGCVIESVTGCYAIRGDGRYGYIDVQYLCNCAGCNGIVAPPYNVRVSYESGLATGTSMQPSMLQALTIVAQINLNEIDVSLSNESTADIAIEGYSDMGYSEKRMKTYNTAFGNSAQANRAARLIRKYRAKPALGFH